jgi:hypothetical protein
VADAHQREDLVIGSFMSQENNDLRLALDNERRERREDMGKLFGKLNH